MSYRSALLLRVVSLLLVGFLLITAVLWLYFRNEVRNIGYYLRFGRREDAAQLIADYLGEPPSRIKAKILAQSFDMSILYREGDRIIWVIEKRGVPFAMPPEYHGDVPSTGRGMMGGGMMDRTGTMRRMGDMMGRMFRMDVRVAGNRNLTIFLPMHFPGKRPPLPFYFFAFIGVLIGLVLFLAVRKTLRPLDMIIEAAERVSDGKLNYRIRYSRRDDFGKVAMAFNDMTEKVSRMLSNQRELLHFISHELRTPLARINIALELKNREKGDEIIKSEIRDIDDLVERVLELSRLDYEGDERVERPLDLVEAVTEVIGGFGAQNIKFHSNLPRAMVGAKGVLVRKSFHNLIDNALKYSPPGSPVAVELNGNGGGYTVSIKNSGPGIAAEETERIWEPFYRGRSSGLSGSEGRGLGLVVVKRAVELCSGTVSVESSAGGPTVFRVWLPALPVGFQDKEAGRNPD